jgi:hypothetical protein
VAWHDPALIGLGKAAYEVRRAGDVIEFSVVNPGNVRATAPIHAIGIPLERSAMIEALYALSPTRSLVLSPGFLKEAG